MNLSLAGANRLKTSLKSLVSRYQTEAPYSQEEFEERPFEDLCSGMMGDGEPGGGREGARGPSPCIPTNRSNDASLKNSNDIPRTPEEGIPTTPEQLTRMHELVQTFLNQDNHGGGKPREDLLMSILPGDNLPVGTDFSDISQFKS